MSLQSHSDRKSINELFHLFTSREINLEPGFQRNSVWTINDRRRLVQSIFSNYPLPSIFFYKRESNGKLIYDVIDGKQRLETIFMFAQKGRFKRDWFDVKLDLGEGLDWTNWQDIRRIKGQEATFKDFKLDVVEVTGTLPEIVDLFVRINSTGKRLTTAEKRNARFYESRFLKEADRLVKKYEHSFLLKNKILSPSQLDRMKGTELVCELLMSIHTKGIINKKAALDRAIGNESVNGNTLHKISREFRATVSLFKLLFPDIKETRFHNSADFYSLFMVVWDMRERKFALKDRKRNLLASRLLKKLSSGVDELRDQLKNARLPKQSARLYSDYLLTIQGDTDSAAHRQRRAEIIRGILYPLFEFKDSKRSFSPEQKRLLWNSDETKLCPNPKKNPNCLGKLSWETVTIDHIFPYAKGGKATLKNAQLLCRSCNSKKGAS